MWACGGSSKAPQTASTVPASTAPAALTPAPAPTAALADPHSFARPGEARVTHVALDLSADFASKVLSGTATLSIVATPGAREIVLDSDGLEISAIKDTAGHALSFAFGSQDALLGRPLHVALLPGTQQIIVHYRTKPEAGALQWLTPEQTAGKRQPYLFSQGQAILTRSWIPTQDSPAVRQTYEAKIRVPEALTALMSAEMLTPQGEPDAAGWKRFSFRAKEPIPPYLIALAVGDIRFQALGARTGVYAEPSVLARAAHEFADLEKMLKAAELIGGPYRWGRYDVLVLPPSFPYGGMENPRLTFLTPTIIAGDRSLVTLAAHELAHSWSGNLATNATWGDTWLNEGFTTYFESRIMESFAGVERAAMLELLERNGLQAAMRDVPAADTALNLDLKGRDPGVAAVVAYGKGAALLRTIETTVGRPRFDYWLRSYFGRHAFAAVSTADFVKDLRENLLAGDAALEAQLRLDEWLYGPGLPSNAYQPVSDAFTKVEAQARAYLAGGPSAKLETSSWSPLEWQHFLETLFREKLAPERASELERRFALNGSQNSEIIFAWLRLAIQCQLQEAVPVVERFLLSQGRRKFLAPLYGDLMKTDWGRPIAKRLYERARPTYHPVSVGTLDKILQGKPAQ